MTRDFEIMMKFLWARLREDETAAHALKPGKNEDVIRLRDRVLADVEAKRRLLHWVHEIPWVVEDRPRSILEGALVNTIAGVPLKLRSPVALTLLASYVDHPDFRPQWKLIVGAVAVKSTETFVWLWGLWCGYPAFRRVVDPGGLGYFGWCGASAEAFGMSGVGSGESDGALITDLFGGAEVDAGGRVPSDA